MIQREEARIVILLASPPQSIWSFSTILLCYLRVSSKGWSPFCTPNNRKKWFLYYLHNSLTAFHPLKANSLGFNLAFSLVLWGNVKFPKWDIITIWTLHLTPRLCRGLLAGTGDKFYLLCQRQLPKPPLLVLLSFIVHFVRQHGLKLCRCIFLIPHTKQHSFVGTRMRISNTLYGQRRELTW